MDWTAVQPTSVSFPVWVRVRFLPWICAIVFLILTSGCAHYPINQPLRQSDPQGGYRAKNFKHVAKDDGLLVMLTFSGGGTRAAAFSYGVLEALRDTEISIRGHKKRMLDEVDFISGVSGGSFTAAYYGLFGDRIFDDFESRFLKKDIQGDLISGMILSPVNWTKLSSPYYRSQRSCGGLLRQACIRSRNFWRHSGPWGSDDRHQRDGYGAWNTVFLYSRSLRRDLLRPSLFLRGPCMRRLLCSAHSVKPCDLAELRRHVWFSIATGARGGHATPKGRYVAAIRSCQ